MKISKQKYAAVLMMLTLSFMVVSPAQAAVPKLLAYEGVIKDSSGNFLTGSYSMTFRLYSASTGGSALWTEAQSGVSASSGKFSVLLGSVTTLGLDFNSDYWLSIQVGSDSEMSPRIRMTSIGYGIRADYETNGFTQTQHDTLSHKNIEGVKDNQIEISKTNFKLDSYSLASANSMGDLILDALNDPSGIDSSLSAGHAWRVSPHYDVIVHPGGIDSNVKLALHANGTDASNTFTDSSSGAKSVTAFDNAQIDTAQFKFGSASALFDGTGDYLSLSDSADWNFGSGDFTIDSWIRFNSLPGAQCGIIEQSGGGSSGWAFYYHISAGLTFRITSSAIIQVPWTPSTNTWYHIALTRSGNNWRIFVNGTQIGSTVSNATSVGDYAQVLELGRQADGGIFYYFNGWVDEIRVTKGVATWTANFTPPSAEYGTPASTATVISNAYSEPAAPTEAMIIADETIGSGSITYSVSRDNGTTWTQCAKETITSISSQPSGTQVKWKAVITGNAELNAIAVAV